MALERTGILSRILQPGHPTLALGFVLAFRTSTCPQRSFSKYHLHPDQGGTLLPRLLPEAQKKHLSPGPAEGTRLGQQGAGGSDTPTCEGPFFREWLDKLMLFLLESLLLGPLLPKCHHPYL